MIPLMWLAACGDRSPAPEPAPPPERVRFEAPDPAERVPVATLPARVVAAPGAIVRIGPGVTGRVAAWHVAPGQRVSAGDPLADLVSAELTGLSSRVSELGTALDQLDRRLADRREALAFGVATAAEVSEIEAQRASAASALQAARSQAATRSDGATRAGAVWTWRAPTAGVVDGVDCAIGQVEQGDACVVLVADAEVLLEVWVPERVQGRLEGPATAWYTGADGREAGFVESARSPRIDEQRRARRVWFVPTDVDEASLPGSAGRARIEVAAREGDLVVPGASILRDGAEQRVFVEQPEGDARPTPVQVLGRRGDDAVVRGLAPGERVAVTGVFLLASLAALAEADGASGARGDASTAAELGASNPGDDGQTMPQGPRGASTRREDTIEVRSRFSGEERE